MKKIKLIDKHLSWLKFNERVLQEAENKTLLLSERIKFLSIFSSNLDEFFSVKVAILKRYLQSVAVEHPDYLFPEKIIHDIHEEVIRLQKRFENCFEQIISELKNNNIYFINEQQLTVAQKSFVKKYFNEQVRPHLMPVLIDKAKNFPYLKDKTIYLAVTYNSGENTQDRHAVIELPSSTIISRFLIIPSTSNKKYVLFIDDVIRVGLNDVFAQFGSTSAAAYTLKMNRDAELDINEDTPMDYEAQIVYGLKARKKGRPVRLVYDRELPKPLLNFIVQKIKLRKKDDLIPGGRYHNFKDFMYFPTELIPEKIAKLKAFTHPDFGKQNIMNVLEKKDVLLYFPYHSFQSIIDLIREAALDPDVVSIKMTMYRLAKNSLIVHALRNAINNGKQVTVVVELKARFDEEANLYWAQKLKDDGAKVCYGIPELKIHGKILQITKKTGTKLKHYTVIGTGNFNEQTAQLYTDTCLLTTHTEISTDVTKLFSALERQVAVPVTKHIITSPNHMSREFIKLINFEIAEVKAGRPASIFLKMNSFSDPTMIYHIYTALKAGVDVKLIIRGICCLPVQVTTKAYKHLQAISIIDSYLEHARIFYFHHAGKEKIFISSGDWMTRNLKRRVEVSTPIHDAKLKAFLKNILNIQLQDNQKARYLTSDKLNTFVKRNAADKKIRSQYFVYTQLNQK